MGLFSRKEKRKPQTVDIENEINRIAKCMYDYEGKIESVVVDKIFISERDYQMIWKGICKVIAEVVEEQGQGLASTETFKVISKGQNIANRIIDKLYEIDWNY
ncbi:hypothetical protein ACEN9X_05135 [Mucilaginibacter sp. Mucisp86]|uniref:hypothetical protein n=1 Tax=Mucilaginibacter sp. Mucisp86 TaxID=3243060 RepID=UPI0039B62D2F